jgi:hypothetical protein
MKRPALLFALLFTVAQAGESTPLKITAEDWAEGAPPKDVFVVDGTIQVTSQDGNKVLTVQPDPITDASAQLGVSAAGEASIQARILGTKRGRSSPKFGVAVHGMSGHRLLLNAPKRQLELVKNDEVLASAPFTWASGAWVWLKLEARRGEGEAWQITGKVWAAEATEPAEAQIKHADQGLKGQGKVSVWGTPYSEEPIHFDDIEIRVETAAK